MIAEFTMGGKWLELLKEIAPSVTRVAVIRDATNPAGIAQFGVINAMAPSLRVEAIPINMANADEIERDVAAFARSPNGGLIIAASGASIRYRELIITLAARHRLPAVYWAGFYVTGGGLISYGVDLLDQYRARLATSTESLKVRSPLTCRFKRRPSMSLQSTSGPRRRSASLCRPRCSRAPAR